MEFDNRACLKWFDTIQIVVVYHKIGGRNEKVDQIVDNLQFFIKDKIMFLRTYEVFASNDTQFLFFLLLTYKQRMYLQLSNFRTKVIVLFWLTILSHSVYTYRCNKSFCIWMTIFPKGLPNLFSILKPNILTEVRLTNGVTNRSK